MPQPAIHVLLSTALLDRWRSTPASAPFLVDEVSAMAFIHGSLGPDLGLFPGGVAELSRLAHFGRTGALLRGVLAHAGTDTQRAYAWGWLTHILADIAIHPLVNRAAHELYGERTLAGHVAVEVGLDTHFTWQHDLLTSFRVRPVFARDDFAFLQRAFGDVHGFPVSADALMRMQRGMVRFTNLSLLFATSQARELCWRDARAAYGRSPLASGVWHVASRAAPRGSLARAYLNPVLPQPWLLSSVGDILADFHHAMDDVAANGLDAFPDYNLETGRITTAQDAMTPTGHGE